MLFGYYRINLGLTPIKIGFGKIHLAFFIWCILQTVSCLIYLGFKVWATVANKRSANPNGERRAFNKIMLGVFSVTQIGLIYGTVQLVLFFDLPPASSITILMEMVIKTVHNVHNTNIYKFINFR